MLDELAGSYGGRRETADEITRPYSFKCPDCKTELNFDLQISEFEKYLSPKGLSLSCHDCNLVFVAKIKEEEIEKVNGLIESIKDEALENEDEFLDENKKAVERNFFLQYGGWMILGGILAIAIYPRDGVDLGFFELKLFVMGFVLVGLIAFAIHKNITSEIKERKDSMAKKK